MRTVEVQGYKSLIGDILYLKMRWKAFGKGVFRNFVENRRITEDFKVDIWKSIKF